MPVDETDMVRIAQLARLHLPADAGHRYRSDINRILALVGQLNTVSTNGIEPLAHPLDLNARLRSDVVTEQDQRARFQQGAPLVQDGHYLVPKVIE